MLKCYIQEVRHPVEHIEKASMQLASHDLIVWSHTSYYASRG